MVSPLPHQFFLLWVYLKTFSGAEWYAMWLDLLCCFYFTPAQRSAEQKAAAGAPAVRSSQPARAKAGLLESNPSKFIFCQWILKS